MTNLFKSSAQLIDEIHHEFDSAQDRLLAEAKQIIESGNEDMGVRLRNAGFLNTPVAKKIDGIVKSKEQAELISYYKRHYPLHKFLTEEELDRICIKYKLVYAPVGNYIKNVPENNLKDIENAPLLSTADRVDHVHLLKLQERYISSKCPKKIKAQLINGFLSACQFNGMNINRCIQETFKTSENWYSYNTMDYELITIDKSGLFIAAPVSHFNKQGLKKKGLGLFNITIREVKDPIVFRYCRGGIQVITKWGKEAEDEALVNEILN